MIATISHPIDNIRHVQVSPSLSPTDFFRLAFDFCTLYRTIDVVQRRATTEKFEYMYFGLMFCCYVVCIIWHSGVLSTQ